MARDEAVLERTASAGDGAKRRGFDGAVGRRSYLKLAGAGMAAATVTTGTVGAAAGGSTDRSNVVTVVGRGEPASFELTVDGTIETTVDEPAAAALVVSGTTVEGAVGDDAVSFPIDGRLTDVTILDGEADVYLNGDPVDPADVDA